MYLERDGKECGICGEKTDLKDTLGKDLYVGDIVVVVNTDTAKGLDIQGENIIVKDSTDKRYHVMGLYSINDFSSNSEWNIYRAIPYDKIPEGYRDNCHTYKDDKKEMTIQEIEKELGYSIKIVKEK